MWMIPVALTGGAMSTSPFPTAFGLLHKLGSDLSPRRAAFWAWHFTNLFPIGTREHIAGFTLKNLRRSSPTFQN